MHTDAQNEGSMLLLINVNAWIATIAQLFTETKIRIVHLQTLYVKHHSKILFEAINQLVGTITHLVHI